MQEEYNSYFYNAKNKEKQEVNKFKFFTQMKCNKTIALTKT